MRWALSKQWKVQLGFAGFCGFIHISWDSCLPQTEDDCTAIKTSHSSNALIGIKGESNVNREDSALNIHIGNTCPVPSDSSKHVTKPSSLPPTATRIEWPTNGCQPVAKYDPFKSVCFCCEFGGPQRSNRGLASVLDWRLGQMQRSVRSDGGGARRAPGRRDPFNRLRKH